ncbi:MULTISPECIES: hypothetical protein [unclassified Geodermatophilus]
MAASGVRVSSGTHGLGSALLRALRPVAVVVLAPLVVLGALLSPGPSLAVGAAFAALAGGSVRLLHRASIPDLPPLPHPALVAAHAALLPAAVAGTAALGLLPFGLLAGVLAPAIAIGWWGGSVCEPGPHASVPAVTPQPDAESVHDFLRSLPVDVLLAEWRDLTGMGPSRDEDSGVRHAWRCMLVAELRRRDPAGTSRWLSEAPGVPPDGYVQDTTDGPR